MTKAAPAIGPLVVGKRKGDTAQLPRVMPFKRAATDAGFSYTSLRDAHFRGELAIVRVGRAWYIEVAELVRFVERHREEMAS